MGQGQSLRDAAPTPVVWVHDKLRSQALSIKQIATLQYEDVLNFVTELNEVCSSFTDDSGKKLLFMIKHGTDTTVLWKATIRIKCIKKNAATDQIESSRVLNLKQFIRLYHEITAQSSPATLETNPKQSSITASMILSEAEEVSTADDTDECIICMERKSDVILPCAHCYCENCIDQWSVSSRTCPVCRAAVVDTDETWVLTTKPDSSQVASEMKECVMGLAEKAGRPHPQHIDE